MILIIIKVRSVCFKRTVKINAKNVCSDSTNYNKNQKHLYSDNTVKY